LQLTWRLLGDQRVGACTSHQHRPFTIAESAGSAKRLDCLAESLGCLRLRVEKPADIPSALEKALAARKPVVIDIVTDHRAFASKTWTGSAAAGH